MKSMTLKPETTRISSPVVDVTFDVVVNHYAWDVHATYNFKTKEVSIERVGVYGVQQFATDVVKGDVAEVYAKLQKLALKAVK